MSDRSASGIQRTIVTQERKFKCDDGHEWPQKRPPSKCPYCGSRKIKQTQREKTRSVRTVTDGGQSDEFGGATEGNVPEPTRPNCPEHNSTMRWDEEDESWYCPEPCGWRFHI
jgi:DNA-directed RNA polymerase subunit RPC12/RpoP